VQLWKSPARPPQRHEFAAIGLDLLAILGAALASSQTSTSLEPLEIDKQVPPDLPPVLADDDQIGRVLINLLDNALKFSPRHRQITVLAEQWCEESEFVRCAVRDTGPGVPPEYRSRIFERYVQIEAQPPRRHGSGIGLSFCQLAGEAHGGHIWVDDAPGGGSEFSFTLKVASECAD
jgi:signal transduction histidine kinase